MSSRVRLSSWLRWSILPASLLSAACPKPGTTGAGAVPTWDDGGGEPDGVLAAHDPPASGGEAEADGASTPADPSGGAVADADGGAAPATEGGTAAADGGAADGGAADGGAADGGAADGGAAPSEPVALELPKALHTKIDSSCGKDEGLGTKLKSFELAGVDGKKSSNKSFRGRVVLVNFWGTWCKPCLKELPEFDQLYRRYRKYGLSLVAIATDEDPAPVKEFIDKRKLAAKVLIGAEDYAGEYGSPKFPFSFVVDDKGVIRASYRGYRPECLGKLEADLRKQLEARAAK
ncbi:MAG: TlpA family protein disulfide reductase [Deltaproteobacteria bacterium]|nr:TlpA family protein disulfide reductase [Deltaproteobacteria bacterium]MBK8716223.1 TlpA family protein disulfide reductase [Deltaproteobacteria bacterium]MBP7290344.1 TlpA family protein disulfide reductase [Nannocystaceae bacterium]